MVFYLLRPGGPCRVLFSRRPARDCRPHRSAGLYLTSADRSASRAAGVLDIRRRGTEPDAAACRTAQQRFFRASRNARLDSALGCGHMELDPLIVLLDFLVGDSVEVLARKNRLPNEHVEQALRAALSAYGFHAKRDQPDAQQSRP